MIVPACTMPHCPKPPSVGLYPYPELAPPFVPPWLEKPPVIVLPVEPYPTEVRT